MEKSDFLKDSNDKNVDITINLHRSDLQRDKIDLPLNDISIFDFRYTSLSRGQMNRASIITFIDEDGKSRDLKNRYASWPLK